MSMQSSGRRRSFRRPRITGALTLIMLATQSGCYTYAPAAGELAPGAGVAYTLTDRGRVAVTDRVGPGVLRVEGTLVQNTGSEYVLAVSRVRTLDGSISRWAGERVTVAQDHVANSFERRFSKPRTALAVGATVVGITVFVLTRSLLAGGFGFLDPDGRNPDPDQ
jgi:hypothetical protein